MPSEDLTSVLHLLDARDVPAAVRLDRPAPLSGRIAVLPSAFNPPTAAHVALLEVGIEGGAHAAAALLSTKNVDKSLSGATLAQRVDMLLALSSGRSSMAVLATNAARIADQAAALRQAHPHADFDFVVGFDTLVRLFEPRYYDNMEQQLETFFSYHRVVATNRGQAGVDLVVSYVEGEVPGRFRERILIRELHEFPASLSSTVARDEAARMGRPLSVPSEVADYIERHRLYTAAP
jgi:nicotinic acid mononucleotide adenylyltransferase